jgi:hypothetical protein
MRDIKMASLLAGPLLFLLQYQKFSLVAEDGFEPPTHGL